MNSHTCSGSLVFCVLPFRYFVLLLLVRARVAYVRCRWIYGAALESAGRSILRKLYRNIDCARTGKIGSIIRSPAQALQLKTALPTSTAGIAAGPTSLALQWRRVQPRERATAATRSAAGIWRVCCGALCESLGCLRLRT